MAELNPEINKITPGSSLDVLYKRLLKGFKEAQDEKMPDFTGPDYVSQNGTDYIVDTDKINASIKEHKNITVQNSAYLLASSIVGNTGGGSGGSGEGTGLFVSLSGDSMTGKLETLYGFSAGADGIKILDIYRTQEENEKDCKNIVKIDGELHINPHGLFIGDKNVLSYADNKLVLSGDKIELNGAVKSNGSITVGNVQINNDGIKLLPDNHIFYHAGNSNKNSVDWTMRNGIVDGLLTVAGNSEFGGSIMALNGFKLGFANKPMLYNSSDKEIVLDADLKVTGVYKLGADIIINKAKENIISISAPSKSLNLGDNKTNQINLITNLFDNSGTLQLVSRYGDGYFPNSFQASHQRGDILMCTYRNSNDDEGIVINEWLRFNNKNGVGINGTKTGELNAVFPFSYTDNGVLQTVNKSINISVKSSESLFAPLNRRSSSVFFTIDSDFYIFNKPVEAFSSIGIVKSKTRLAENQLFFGDLVYLQGLTDGIKHYGNSYITGNIGSEKFSSGLAGSGWQIGKNKTTGNISATFDELTVRKKMRLYELEVQKTSTTNGSLWVSDSCSGDYVISIA